jgi:hypothetical protein
LVEASEFAAENRLAWLLKLTVLRNRKAGDQPSART